MARILVVEDDPGMLRMYERAFRFAGHKVEGAADGKVGLEKIKEVLPELILLDIMMPKVNGMEVLSALKANSQTKNIPVVMMTNITSGTLPAAKAAVAKKWARRYIVKSEMTPKEVVALAEETLKGGDN